ncbi:MAG: hypothetical protein FJY88_13780 [Candidatus Eisenbacteria bacterium]|nr:hypothetical protein [Candidatus Eisenbacteria bacterium]
MLGTRQTGMPRLRVADLFRDRDLLERARAEAEDLSGADPNLQEARHRALRAEVDRHGRERTRLLGVA